MSPKPIPPHLLAKLADPDMFAKAHVGTFMVLYLPLMLAGVDLKKVTDSMENTLAEAVRQRDKYMQENAKETNDQLDQILNNKV